MTTAEKLQQARDARHRLYVGLSVRVFVDQNGERVEYTATTISKLDSYIAELEAELAGTPLPVRRPLRFLF